MPSGCYVYVNLRRKQNNPTQSSCHTLLLITFQGYGCYQREEEKKTVKEIRKIFIFNKTDKAMLWRVRYNFTHKAYPSFHERAIIIIIMLYTQSLRLRRKFISLSFFFLFFFFCLCLFFRGGVDGFHLDPHT